MKNKKRVICVYISGLYYRLLEVEKFYCILENYKSIYI